MSLFVLAMSLPAVVWAQTGTIAGSVRDATGGVLPGVTVEATSPALIEKVRTAVTDGEGVYRIVDLRPGTYTVTFALPGFSTVRREGLVLTAGITANVTAEMRVGGVEETITVSGQAPLVDVANVTQHTAITRDVLNDLPTGRQFGNYAVLVPGVTTNQQDVGGSGVVQSTTNMMAVHGSNSNEMPLIIDGMRYSNIFGQGAGASGPYLVNNGMVEELAIDTSGSGADHEVAGVYTNVILKQGGNNFSGSLFGSYNNDALVMDNANEALRARNTPTSAKVDRLWDVNISGGGPLRRDRIWFYGSYRSYGIYVEPVGAAYALNPNAIVFVPDPGRKALNENKIQNENLRVTWQATQNAKLSLYGDQQQRCICANGLSSSTAFEATTVFKSPHDGFDGLFSATWNWTATNKLLIELGEAAKPDTWAFVRQPTQGADSWRVVDSGRGITSGSAIDNHNTSLQFNGKAIMTYVTGSHNLKIGGQWFHGHRTNTVFLNHNAWLNLLNGVPVSVTQRTTPLIAEENVDMNLGIFAQEQYTLNRITANLGVRYDYLHGSVPEQHRAAVEFIGPRDFAKIDNVPNWQDISPRLGLTWDVFGTGRTAVKWSLGRYLETQAGGFPEAVNPLRGSAGVTASRPWTDTNGNLRPDCNLANLSTNGECGPIDNANFGQSLVPVRYDPATVTGWGNRLYNWELMAGVEHELFAGFSMDVSYNRRSFGNFRAFVNTAVRPGDFDPYCVTRPTDPRLPGGGGQQVCGFYDISPASGKFGLNDTLITTASNIGDVSQVYNGVDLAGQLRLHSGVLLQGGLSVGRLRINQCDLVIGHPEVTAATPYLGSSSNVTVNLGTTGSGQVPRTPAFCDPATPYTTQVKLSGVYPLPVWGIQASATLQSLLYPQDFSSGYSLPGILAERTYTSAEIATGAGGLGRPLAGGVRTASLNILEPGQLYEGRMYQLDFRLGKKVTVRRTHIRPQFDIYNLFNDNTVLTQNNTFGANWRRPVTVLQGTTFKFGAQVDF